MHFFNMLKIMVTFLKRHSLKYFIFITQMISCNAQLQECCIGQIKYTFTSDDFENLRRLRSGQGFCYERDWVLHITSMSAGSLKTRIYMIVQFKNYLMSCFAILTLFFWVANTFPCCYLLLLKSSSQYSINKSYYKKTNKQPNSFRLEARRVCSPASMKFVLYCLCSWVSGVKSGKPDELLWSLFPAKACRVSFWEILATYWSLCAEGAVKEKNKKE